MKATSRTHEENQERAYIAASRRSDRSVEARVESARRASEIHKRRTGKSLKVTEKDVLADEMYEEEDDELPAQYRNLNAHLQTGSSDFDARLQAYLANAVAFRKALSGVAKPGDRRQHADFVNKKQLADHTSLFPKHSDAWKDIVIPKCTSTSSSPYLPQGSSHKYAPYNAKNSGLGQRRESMNKGDSSMGTLRASDLSPKHTAQFSSRRLSDSSSATPDYSMSGINYDAIDQRSSSASSTSMDHLFTARLPANALDMLMPEYQTNIIEENESDQKFGYESMFGETMKQKMEESIDATLVGPTAGNMMQTTSAPYDQQQFNLALWDDSAVHSDSASRKVLENDMWGSYIDEESGTQAWDWQNELTA